MGREHSSGCGTNATVVWIATSENPGFGFVARFIIDGAQNNFDLEGMSVFVGRRPDLLAAIGELIDLHRRAPKERAQFQQWLDTRA